MPRAARCDWETPPALFAQWDAEFGFTLDAAASPGNAKCARYFTESDDGLTQPWTGERVWCNPPYGHDRLWRWVAKGHTEAQRGALVVMLTPAYTATRWWHTYTPDAEVRFLKGKIQFVGAKDRASFASALLIFGGGHRVGRPSTNPGSER
jgi:site-specific DNA-methyltransferase (adenine-specific)